MSSTSSAHYQHLPSSPQLPVPSTSPSSYDPDPNYGLADEERLTNYSPRNRHIRITHAHDPRFDLPTPPAWQRAALLLCVCFLFWLFFRLRGDPRDGMRGWTAGIE